MAKPKKPVSLMTVVHFGGYPFDVLFCVDVKTERIARFLRARGEDVNDELVRAVECPGRGRTASLPGGRTVLRLDTWDGSPFYYAILAHEVFHAVNLLFDRIGIALSDSSGEAFAYAIQDLTQRLLTVLRNAAVQK